MAESCDKVPQSGEGGEEGGSVADVQAHAVLILLACACDSSYRQIIFIKYFPTTTNYEQETATLLCWTSYLKISRNF